ncbi:MAG: glycoside hydrolase family 3 C-terminal domain-containing protein, partial [Bifidobacteriaceae bacterium]|nr:glycoside hydrolase family 3 C-terminal domain-containing protein [Bifidobacteriaceae bacterium]
MADSFLLIEQAALVTGRNAWQSHALPARGLRSIWFSDGPHGLRRPVGSADQLGLAGSLPATCFPVAAAVANSWDLALAEQIGAALAAEAISQDVDCLLGPGLNIKRSPLGGRNFEYFSEDPLLSGKLAAAYIRGIQSRGVAACPKHFAANSQEFRRMTSDSVVDQRTLREIYLAGFEIAVREAGPRAIMAAYNKVNGTHASENGWLLTEVLRHEWGFDGVVVTDWGASNDIAAGLAAGCSLEMPAAGYASARQIAQAVKSGRLPRSSLAARASEVANLARWVARARSARHAPTPVSSPAASVSDITEHDAVQAADAHHPAAPVSDTNKHDAVQAADAHHPAAPGGGATLPGGAIAAAGPAAAAGDFDAHHALARRAAAAGAVLLKNEGGLLPLAAGTKVAVIGRFAEQPRYQGGGSSAVNPRRLENTLEAIKRTGLVMTAYQPGFRPDGRPDAALREAAVAAAAQAEAVLVYLGLDESADTEGADRRDLALPTAQVELLAAVAAVNPRV